MTQKHPDRVDESLIALRRILRATELYARDLAQAAGVTPAQLRVLQIVGEKTNPTAKMLATQMGVSQATVTALVDKLVARHEAGEPLAGRAIKEVVTVNGARVILDNGSWGLVRASSNTPNLVVVCESSESEDEMRAIFNDIDAVIRTASQVGEYDQTI